MSALGPTVVGDRIIFRVPDPGSATTSVALDVHPVLRGLTEFARRGPGHDWVLEFPGYAAPAWLREPTAPGLFDPFHVEGGLGARLPVTVWQPDGIDARDPVPLLVVQDGPEYEHLVGLTRYSAALIASGRLPAHRLALCQPV